MEIVSKGAKVRYIAKKDLIRILGQYWSSLERHLLREAESRHRLRLQARKMEDLARAVSRRYGLIVDLNIMHTAGFSLYDFEPGVMVLKNFYIHPGCRGQGLGSLLLKRTAQEAQRNNASRILCKLFEESCRESGLVEWFTKRGFQFIKGREYECDKMICDDLGKILYS